MSTESRNDVAKTLLHTRDVSSKGYIRTDGMFDIEGIITDKKSYDIPKSDGTILKEGDPLHKMVVKITLDINMTIIDVSAETLSAPYDICTGANFKIKNLIGEEIGPGWKTKLIKSLAIVKDALMSENYWSHWQQSLSRPFMEKNLDRPEKH